MDHSTTRFLKTFLVLAVLLILPSMASASIIRSTDVIDGHNRFAVELYQALGEDGGNLFFSPLSISTALSMTYAGAMGQTAAEMQKTLHFPKVKSSLHHGNNALLHLLENNQLKLANGLWPAEGETLLDSFLENLHRNYGAECQTLNFARNPEKATETINKWVEENTNGRIAELLQPTDIDSGTRLVLANAIVFDGKWEQAFDPDKTVSMPFMLEDGRKTWVKAMVQKSDFMVAEMDGFKVLELPFDGGKTSLLIALPDQIDGLADLEKLITPEAIDRWISKMRETELNLVLPRMEMDERLNLVRVLIKLGIDDAFGAKADFSGITGDKGLFIDTVIHQASLKIHEEGVEAAAATAVTFKRFSMVQSFKVDHPFVFMIRHRSTGSILFMGRILNPEN